MATNKSIIESEIPAVENQFSSFYCHANRTNVVWPCIFQQLTLIANGLCWYSLLLRYQQPLSSVTNRNIRQMVMAHYKLPAEQHQHDTVRSNEFQIILICFSLPPWGPVLRPKPRRRGAPAAGRRLHARFTFLWTNCGKSFSARFECSTYNFFGVFSGPLWICFGGTASGWATLSAGTTESWQ